MNWKYNDKEYPAVDVRLVECNVTVGSGMRTHDEIHPHRIAILDAEVAAIVLFDNPIGKRWEIGTARGCPESGLESGHFRGLPALREHAGHGFWRTVAIIGDASTVIPPRE